MGDEAKEKRRLATVAHRDHVAGVQDRARGRAADGPERVLAVGVERRRMST